MSQSTPTPTLPKPDKATVQAITPATLQQPSFWLGVLQGLIAATALLADRLPDILQALGPILNDQWRVKLGVVAIIVGILRGTAVKHEQTQATARVAELTPTMPPQPGGVVTSGTDPQEQ